MFMPAGVNSKTKEHICGRLVHASVPFGPARSGCSQVSSRHCLARLVSKCHVSFRPSWCQPGYLEYPCPCDSVTLTGKTHCFQHIGLTLGSHWLHRHHKTFENTVWPNLGTTKHSKTRFGPTWAPQSLQKHRLTTHSKASNQMQSQKEGRKEERKARNTDTTS